jgi:hypothetical protein
LRSKLSKNQTILLSAAAVIVIGGVLVFAANRNTGKTTVLAHTPTPSPSPGQPGNAGDQAKSSISASASNTPAASTPTPVAATIAITDFTVLPRSGGQVHVTSQVTGATTGTCTMALTSPTGASKSFTGILSWSGTYYNCSFGTTSGVTQLGDWEAQLTVTSAGKVSNMASTAFTVVQ